MKLKFILLPAANIHRLKSTSKTVKVALILVIPCLFILYSFHCITGMSDKPGDPGKREVKRPYVIGHRGIMLEAPENTLAGFSKCVEQGIGIEIDGRTSKDNRLVIIHDDNFSRTTNGPALPIRELTLSEIKKLDAGSWFSPEFKGEKVPTLEETLRLERDKQKGKVPVAVNIKDVSLEGEAELVALLKKYDLLDQSFCFDQSRECSERLKAIEKGIRIAQNVEKRNLKQELNNNFIDVFLIWFIPSGNEVDQLRKSGKGIVLNLGGPRDHDNDPSWWHGFLTSGVDAVLIDHASEFNKYLDSLKWD